MPTYNGEQFASNEAMWAAYPFLAPEGFATPGFQSEEALRASGQLEINNIAAMMAVGTATQANIDRLLELQFIQASVGIAPGGIPPGGFVALPEGADLRDFANPLAAISLEDPDMGGGEGNGQFGSGLTTTALQLIRAFLRSPGRVTAATWGLIPPWARTILIQAGIGIGTMITIDMLGGGDSEAEGGGAGLVDSATGHLPVPLAPGQVHGDPLGVHSSAHIIGGWVSNGVQFYRLSNGKLGVLKKNGVWKEWRPKRPVVLYAGGVKDIKTLLKADKILAKEGKKLRKYLDRVAPRPRKSKKAEVIAITGQALPIHHA